MICLTIRLMIFLILSLSKDAENHLAPMFAEVFINSASHIPTVIQRNAFRGRLYKFAICSVR